jgi:hypothetical protein
MTRSVLIVGAGLAGSTLWKTPRDLCELVGRFV